MTTAPSTTDPIPPTGGIPSWHPLSDHHRGPKIAAAIFLLLAGMVCFVGIADLNAVDITEMQAAPALHDGEPVELGNFRVREISGDRAHLWAPWTTVWATNLPPGLTLGDLVSIQGIFHRDGTVAIENWHIHQHHLIKKGIGIGGVLLVLTLIRWELLSVRRRRA